MSWKQCYQVAILSFGIWLVSQGIASLGIEVLWFEELQTLPIFWRKLSTQAMLWLVGTGFSAIYVLGNLVLAQRLQAQTPVPPTTDWPQYPKLGLSSQPHYPQRPPARLKPTRFLLLLLVLILGSGLLLWGYGQTVSHYWHPQWEQPEITPYLPPALGLNLWQVLQNWQAQPWWGLPLAGYAIAVLLLPGLTLTAAGTVLSLLLGFILASHWSRVLQAFHPTAFQAVDPLFQQDIGFYVFWVPLLELLQYWLLGLLLFGLLSTLLSYLLARDHLNQGYFPGFTRPQIQHIKGLTGITLLAIAASFGLSRYQLVFSSNGVSYGASYTDVHVLLPGYTLLSALSLGLGLLFLGQALFPGARSRLPLSFLGIYGGMIALALVILPASMQYLIVRPNELLQEKPYIQRTINLTRRAFNLEKAEVRTFIPRGQLTQTDLQANALTIRNIRLWDQRPLLQTNRELQQIRLYYRFPDADLDRYPLRQTPTQGAPISTTAERQQVLIAARELDFTAVPLEAQTWVNEHLIYTHGYGFTVSPVNRVAPGGLPEYFVKDIGAGESGVLSTDGVAIQNSIPVENPRIYYGEITNTYVMTGTRVKELDYPSGDENVYNVYDGKGGIQIGNSVWRKLLFARYLTDWRLFLTRDFLPETKLLLRRNINQRIRTIAPFLRYDASPYLVSVNIPTADRNPPPSNQPSHLYWIVDAYTTTRHYPYSDPGAEEMNYIRNSVKVVVDAYNGSVKFYIADPSDPLVQTWAKIFPSLFQPLAAMPAALREHIRYPADLFEIQSRQLMTYHMTDPQVFYNREDLWQIPKEIYGSEAQLVKPYYLITSLPGVPFEEFILLLPFTPNQRTNLTAWFAARSDGENYGKLLLYEFPKQTLIYGPEQIEARINQDPVISQQISLWNRQGSRAIQGNLLVIPIEQSLLYVEPIYLEAAENSLPTLVRVVVAYENQIVMAPSLELALQAIFQEKQTAPAIVRPVEGQP